jgi:hypothetical protein
MFFLSGVFPESFLPSILRSIGSLLPTTMLNAVLDSLMVGGTLPAQSLTALAGLVAYTAIFAFIAAGDSSGNDEQTHLSFHADSGTRGVMMIIQQRRRNSMQHKTLIRTSVSICLVLTALTITWWVAGVLPARAINASSAVGEVALGLPKYMLVMP